MVFPRGVSSSSREKFPSRPRLSAHRRTERCARRGSWRCRTASTPCAGVSHTWDNYARCVPGLARCSLAASSDHEDAEDARTFLRRISILLNSTDIGPSRSDAASKPASLAFPDQLCAVQALIHPNLTTKSRVQDLCLERSRNPAVIAGGRWQSATLFEGGRQLHEREHADDSDDWPVDLNGVRNSDGYRSHLHDWRRPTLK